MEKIKVWDLPTRAFHWLLVALVLLSWGSVKLGWMTIHQWSGLTVLTLVIFRILWGFVGSQTARFSQFVAAPGAVIEYVKTVFYDEKRLYAGHNPTGGLVVVGFLALLLLQASLGLFANDDILFKGPLAYMVSKDMSDFLTGLHETVFDFLLVLIALHVAAILFYLKFRRENLIRPMVTGYKAADHVPKGVSLSFRSPVWAALLLLAAAALVWWVVFY